MNKQFIISVIVLFVLTTVMGILVHGVLLNEEYAQMPNIMRPQEEATGYMHIMLLAHLLIAIGLTWIYRMGHDPAKPWVAQGARFGIAIALVSVIPLFLIYYAVQQTPESLLISWTLTGSVRAGAMSGRPTPLPLKIALALLVMLALTTIF